MAVEIKEQKVNLPMINFEEPNDFHGDQELVNWLKQLNVGNDVIEMVGKL
jgi:hypothetical protein